MQGVVPAGAVSAEFAVRVNGECGCNGLNDVLLGTLQYQESLGGNSGFTFSTIGVPGYLVGGPIIDTEIVGGTQVARIITFPDQKALWNSPTFNVTPGAHYEFSVPGSTIGGRGWYGTVNLLWLGVNQLEFLRVPVTPGPGKALMSTAVTAADGTFALSRLPRNVAGPQSVTVEFDGGGGVYRPTQWVPLH